MARLCGKFEHLDLLSFSSDLLDLSCEFDCSKFISTLACFSLQDLNSNTGILWSEESSSFVRTVV